MTEAETENIARRYARYCGLRIEKRNSNFKMRIGGFMFTSYSAFLFSKPNAELSYNDLVKLYGGIKPKTLKYSSTEELDFNLSVAGF